MNNVIQRAFQEALDDARFGRNVDRVARDEVMFRAGWSAAKAHVFIELHQRGVLSDALLRQLTTERNVGREDAARNGKAGKGRRRVKDVCSAGA